MGFFLLASLFSLGIGFALTDRISGEEEDDEGDSETAEPETRTGDGEDEAVDATEPETGTGDDAPDEETPAPKTYPKTLDFDNVLDFGNGSEPYYTGEGEVFEGSEGNDWIYLGFNSQADGGEGDDLLILGDPESSTTGAYVDATGGEGNDVFFIDITSDIPGGQPGHTVITDFTPGEDMILYGTSDPLFDDDIDLDISASEADDGSYTDITFSFTPDGGELNTTTVRLDGITGVDPDDPASIFGQPVRYGIIYLSSEAGAEIGQLYPTIKPFDETLPH